MFRASGVNFDMCGIWINQDVTQPFAGTTIGLNVSACGNCFVSNVVVTDIYGTIANSLGMHFVDTSAYLLNGDTNVSGNLAVIGWSQGIGVSSRGMMRYGNAFIGGTLQACFAASMGSTIGIENLQIMGCTGLFQPDSGSGIQLGGGDGNYHGCTLAVDKLCDVADIVGPGIYISGGCRMIVGNPTLTVQRCYYPQGGTNQAGHGIHICTGASMEIQKGVYYATGQPFSQPGLISNITDCFDIYGPPFTYPNIGIYVDDGARFLNYGGLYYNNNDLNALTIQTGQFTSPYDAVSPNNIYQYSSAGSVVMNPVFDQQELCAGGAVLLTMDPAAVFGLDNVYIGRTYTIVSTNTQAHTLSLPGACFVIYGSVNKTVANFDTVNANSMLTFRVESATVVRVMRSMGISFT